MHTMSDKLSISVKLAGQPKFVLAINREDEELNRTAEKLVNDLWARWGSGDFAAESQLSVMARVAYQFATLYLKRERSLRSLEALSQRLDEMLGNLPGLEPDGPESADVKPL